MAATKSPWDQYGGKGHTYKTLRVMPRLGPPQSGDRVKRHD
ncbi:hypothetical protein CCACVL1_26635 [Corchorus capsularis]|uniref:Uncharacterized protein n=1 Tax=Corchorus capsularis TaxID=210143 RepID=A0A1R3GE23_COCAP|nr:hypothetical protein CCACVL1_26635 [Corchorus capsularis]